MSCGGRLAAPTEIVVDDAGLTCSVPMVSTGDGADECTFTVTCTGGLTMKGSYSNGSGSILCYVNGSPVGPVGILGTTGPHAAYDCADTAGIAALATYCRQ